MFETCFKASGLLNMSSNKGLFPSEIVGESCRRFFIPVSRKRNVPHPGHLHKLSPATQKEPMPHVRLQSLGPLFGFVLTGHGLRHLVTRLVVIEILCGLLSHFGEFPTSEPRLSPISAGTSLSDPKKMNHAQHPVG